MNTIRISKLLDSVNLPELKPLLGKKVTISVTEDQPAENFVIKPPPMADAEDIFKDAKPIDDITKFFGTWPGKKDDGFEDMIQEGRHRRFNGRVIDL
ncbi:MAG TPA: hypothetical protein VKX17_02560 [Planctomycetota bacterium]|nr:hypothetical protein [Planctomycetota bacterium]